MEVHKKEIPYGIRWLWASMIRMVTDVISTLWSGIHIGVLGKPYFLLSGMTSFVSWMVMDDISNFRGTYGRGTSHSTSPIFISTSCLDRKVSSLQAFIPLTSTIHGILMTYLSFHCLFMIGIADPKPRNLAWVWVFCQNGMGIMLYIWWETGHYVKEVHFHSNLSSIHFQETITLFPSLKPSSFNQLRLFQK